MSDKPEKERSERRRKEKEARSRQIGAHLKALYNQVANEPVPDDFLSLLEDADLSSAKTKPGNDN